MNTRDEAKKRMYQAIEKHGNNLNSIFNTGLDPVTLCKKLRRIETKATYITTALCNGTIDQDQADAQLDQQLKAVDKILHFTGRNIPVFINRDPRGYALKISDDYVRAIGQNGPDSISIYRDWGGYGILAPDFSEGGN